MKSQFGACSGKTPTCLKDVRPSRKVRSSGLAAPGRALAAPGRDFLYLMRHCSGIFLTIFQLPESSLPALPNPAPGTNFIFTAESHSRCERDLLHSALGSGRHRI